MLSFNSDSNTYSKYFICLIVVFCFLLGDFSFGIIYSDFVVLVLAINLISNRFLVNTEVFFSFFRKIIQKKSPIHPDSKHLHMLTFKNISLTFGKDKGNYINSIIINLVYLIFTLPALIFAKNPMISRYWFFSLIIIYLVIYLRLYRLTKN